jgi:hypothetical protein
MRPRRIDRFKVWTSHGPGSYSSWSKAIAAAEWVASESGDTISVANERTGQRWDVSATSQLTRVR